MGDDAALDPTHNFEHYAHYTTAARSKNPS
jgi:hypothetical protein